MATLAARAAGGSTPGDLFGLLAAAGQHTFAIPTQTPATTTGAPAGGTGPGPAGNPPPGAQGPTPPAGSGNHSGGGSGSGNGSNGSGSGSGSAGAGTPAGAQYDVSSDPVLQQVNAAMALADQNANAAALRQRQQALTAYGDPNLASQLLGANDPYVQAAGQNQEGTVQQLLRAYQAGLHNFDTGLDPSLAYSGYRVGQEGEIGQGYQDNLAQAAAAIQAQLGGYTDQLNQQLEADQQQRVQALADAYNRAVQRALAGGGG